MSTNRIRRGIHKEGSIFQAVKDGDLYRFDSLKVTHMDYCAGLGFPTYKEVMEDLSKIPGVRDVRYNSSLSNPGGGQLSYWRTYTLTRAEFRNRVKLTVKAKQEKNQALGKNLLALCEELNINTEKL